MSADMAGADELGQGSNTPNLAQIKGNISPAEQMARYRSLGEAAAKRKAYQLNWGASDAARAQGYQSAGNQGEAMSYARYVANGGQTRADITGINQLNTGAQNQQAVALSRPGGGLAQAAALRNQQNGQAAFMQSGQQQLAMQHAQAQQQAQQQYMQMTGQMRAGDQAQQDMDEQRAIAQQKAELAQQQLNDQGQMGYEQMSNDAATSGLNSQVHDNAVQASREAAHRAAEQADKDRTQKLVAGGAQSIPIIGGGIQAGADAANNGTTSSNPDPLSDAAAKRQAFIDGMNHADQMQQTGKVPAPPSYMPSTPARAGVRSMDVTNTRTAPGKEMNMPLAPPRDRDAMGKALAEGLAPAAYEYKPEFAASQGQSPGEKNVGIIAQRAEGNPITATIVERGADGLRRINAQKSTSLALAAAGHNAQKIREQQAQIDALKGGR